jgi:hypothetical protein
MWHGAQVRFLRRSEYRIASRGQHWNCLEERVQRLPLGHS